MKRWCLWYLYNQTRAEGFIRNAVYKLLQYTAGRTLSQLGYILRIIYNSGGGLIPVW